MEPSADVVANATRALKRLRAKPIAWIAVTGRGFTPARRWVVTLDDGSTAFVKVATDEMTASWLRDEHVMYSVLRGASFMPGYVGWYDDGRYPVLSLEDLSTGRWPPPWQADDVRTVRSCLEAIASTPPPEGLPRAADDDQDLFGGWAEIERDPAPFLALGICTAGWLEAHLPTLRASAEAAPLEGEALLHFDVRSDNICFRPDGGAALVDWNLTAVGNPLIDLVFWLPSLEAEGGPAPERVLRESHPELSAAVAAFFCARAGRPPVPTAPNVRAVQLAQARTALPWAARSLGLPPPS